MVFRRKLATQLVQPRTPCPHRLLWPLVAPCRCAPDNLARGKDVRPDEDDAQAEGRFRGYDILPQRFILSDMSWGRGWRFGYALQPRDHVFPIKNQFAICRIDGFHFAVVNFKSYRLAGVRCILFARLADKPFRRSWFLVHAVALLKFPRTTPPCSAAGRMVKNRRASAFVAKPR